MSALYVMRHGRTEWNQRRMFQGQTDIPLADEGIEQAKGANDTCKSLSLDVCYVSPLIRAKETARLALAGIDIPIIEDARLKEVFFGPFEGSEIRSFEEGSNMYNFVHHPEKYVSVGGAESLEEVFKRVQEFLDDKIHPELDKGKNVLIAAHGCVNCAIYSIYHDIPREQFWNIGLNNCEVIRVL